MVINLKKNAFIGLNGKSEYYNVADCWSFKCFTGVNKPWFPNIKINVHLLTGFRVRYLKIYDIRNTENRCNTNSFRNIKISFQHSYVLLFFYLLLFKHFKR